MAEMADVTLTDSSLTLGGHEIEGTLLGLTSTIPSKRGYVLSPGYIPSVVFDLLFWANYAVGWTLSLTYQREFLGQSNVARLFGVYNICDGVDSFPARPVASVWFMIAWLWWGQTVWHYNVRMFFDDSESRYRPILRITLLAVGTIFASSFALTYSVPPDDALQAQIHVWAFVAGCFGYSLIKFATGLNFKAAQPNYEFVNAQATIMFASRITAGCALFVAAVYLGYCMVTLDTTYIAKIDSSQIPAVITGPAFESSTVGFDYGGTALVLIVLVDPFLALYLRYQYYLTQKSARALVLTCSTMTVADGIVGIREE